MSGELTKMKIEKGLVSVIMTNYNTPESFLREAIDSVLGQTYSNFEFIIVDDCSTDDSLEVIDSYADPRIKIIKNDKNIGLTKSLNKAMKIASGEYIARMDSDDICYPKRFEKQVEFLNTNQDIVVCGTWARLFGTWKKEQYAKDTVCRSIPEREIYRIMLLFGNYPNIVHASAMFNHNLLRKYEIKYNEKYIYAQDYRMWVECSKYANCAIVSEILMNIRVRDGSITTGKRTTQKDCALKIMQEQLQELNLVLDENTLEFHENFLNKRLEYNIEYRNWIEKIIDANKVNKVYNQKLLMNILWKKWAEVVYFGIRECSLGEKVKELSTLPVQYYPELLKIKRNRKKKGRNNE